MKDHANSSSHNKFKQNKENLSMLRFSTVKKLSSLIGFCLLQTLPAYADSNPLSHPTESNHPWAITASIGYTDFQNSYKNEGQTILGRLAFDRELLNFKLAKFGVEVGVQNGNSMRLSVSQTTLDELGGSPIQTTVKPILDLLATVATVPFGKSSIFAQVKGGIAYRSWQFDDRTSINFLSNIAGEVQAGLGVALNSNTSLSLLYQGIYGGNPDFVVNATNETGTINNIPMQNGVLLSLSVVV